MLEVYETDRIVIEKEITNLPFTYQVINELKKKYPNDELCLIMGADNIVSFDKWKHYKELLKLEFIIYTRNNIDIKYYLDKLNKKDKYIILDKVDNIDISSSKIRDNINNIKIIQKYLDKDVIDYIVSNNLYK